MHPCSLTFCCTSCMQQYFYVALEKSIRYMNTTCNAVTLSQAGMMSSSLSTGGRWSPGSTLRQARGMGSTTLCR